MAIKLIGIDIDGTLLTRKKELTSATVEALQAAADHGIHVVISTGRLLSEFRDLVERLPMMRYTVTCTGCQVIDLQTGTDIFRQGMPAAELQRIYHKLKGFDMMFQAFSDDDGSIHNDAWVLENAHLYSPRALARIMQATHIPETDFDGYIDSYTGMTNKIHIFFRTPEERDKAWKLVEQEPYALMSSTVNDLELMPHGVDKGLGLKKLAAHLGLDISEIMAIGDGGNDVDMLREAGLGVAMANASSDAKAAADHVLAYSNDEDGVAKAVWAVIRKEPLP